MKAKTNCVRTLISGLLPFAFLLALFSLPSTASASDGQYIVVLKEDAQVVQEARSAVRGGKIVNIYNSALKGFTATLSPSDLQRLRNNEEVVSVTRDEQVRTSFARKTKAWNLDRVDQRSLFLDGWINTSSAGRGSKIYIVDSGVDPGHSELRGRVLPGYSIVPNEPETRDCNGHGTHVAGIAAGKRNGVAPAATIVPVRIFDCSGAAFWSEILAGMDWVARNHVPGEKAIANLSFEGDRFAPANRAVQALIDKGIIVVAAAGNDFSNACGLTPASVPGAITVGATDKKDMRAQFSSYGPCVDIFAPGVAIFSARQGTTNGLSRKSGTSMAAPHVAGSAALLLSQNYAALDVQKVIIRRATSGTVLDAGDLSPNKLLYVD